MQDKYKDSLEEFKKIISGCEVVILYKPLTNEISHKDALFHLKIPASNIFIPCDRNSDPFWWANKITTECKNRKTFILIPGRKFDICGTRHGNGGGWYDRFLSKVPRKWPRIGVCHSTQFSTKPLAQKPHDQPVDWIIVKSPEKLSYIKASKFLSSPP